MGAVDMFAVGVMLYVMLYGKYPFPKRGNFGVGPHMRTAHKRAISATYSFPHHPKVSEEAQNFIRSLLSVEPANRPTAEEALRDPLWVRHPDFEEPDDVPEEPGKTSVNAPPVHLPKKDLKSAAPFTDREPDDSPGRQPSSETSASGGREPDDSPGRQPSSETSPLADWTRRQAHHVHDALSRLLF